jgi:hypothetical protein
MGAEGFHLFHLVKAGGLFAIGGIALALLLFHPTCAPAHSVTNSGDAGLLISPPVQRECRSLFGTETVFGFPALAHTPAERAAQENPPPPTEWYVYLVLGGAVVGVILGIVGSWLFGGSESTWKRWVFGEGLG